MTDHTPPVWLLVYLALLPWAIVLLAHLPFLLWDDYLDEPGFSDWETYLEDLREDRRWWSCVTQQGCDWPEFCRPGSCRRPQENDG